MEYNVGNMQKGEPQHGCYKKTKHARDIWRALFFCNTHFEICFFALLPTISKSPY